jgi:hypothetical protein
VRRVERREVRWKEEEWFFHFLLCFLSHPSFSFVVRYSAHPLTTVPPMLLRATFLLSACLFASALHIPVLLKGGATPMSMPSGEYEGTVTVLFKSASIHVNVTSNVHADVVIHGGIEVDCRDELWSIKGNVVEIINANTAGDCVYQELLKYHASLGEVIFNGKANTLHAEIDVKITKEDTVQ